MREKSKIRIKRYQAHAAIKTWLVKLSLPGPFHHVR
jgi:hypothetical protein